MSIRVETSHGVVEGAANGEVLQFRGIPYAKPPIGALRFAAPQPADRWSGVRAAKDYAPSAIQPEPRLPGMAVATQDEDCLYLNVYTKAADEARRPVLFWIHGGGFTGGGASQALYEGAPLVARGDVVLVTISYRLGVLGYLDLPELAGATPNPGQLDQVAALEWVRDNVVRFGGDPDNVTIFGESAGGMSVGTLLAMPRARGLFHKAIAQSGAASSSHSREHAAIAADALLAKLGIARRDAEALRNVAPADLLAAQVAAAAELGRKAVFLTSAPVIDGEVLPASPLDAIRAGAASGVPLMTGTTRDEFNLFLLPQQVASLDRPALLRRLARLLPDGHDVGAIVDRYASAHGITEPGPLFSRIQTDRVFRMPAIWMADAHAAHQPATYMYEFAWPSPAARGALGACHAIELPFVFGTLDAPGMDRFAGSGPEAERLGDRTMDAWLRFARTGDPSHPGLPAWPRYEPENRRTMVLDAECVVVERPGEATRELWG